MACIDPYNHQNAILLALLDTVNKERSDPYELLQRLDGQILEIDEVATGTSLSMGTSPTTENISPFKLLQYSLS